MAKHRRALPHGQVIRKFKSLRTLGVAVEYFPCYVNRKLNMHTLDVVLMTWIVRGRAVHIMGDHRHEETGRSLGITHYGQAHDILTDAAGIEVYNVYLNLKDHGLPRLPPELRGVLPDVLPLHPNLQHEINRRVRLQFDEEEDAITPLIARMDRELRGKAPGAGEVVRDCLRILLIECCRQALRAGEVTRTASAAESSYLERVRRRLDARFAEPQPLEELAAMAQVSPSHLSRAFKRYTGQTIVRYLQQRRIERAMIELRSSDEKVLAIALHSGFNDLAHFNRCFQRIVGCAPGVYRRRDVLT